MAGVLEQRVSRVVHCNHRYMRVFTFTEKPVIFNVVCLCPLFLHWLIIKSNPNHITRKGPGHKPTSYCS